MKLYDRIKIIIDNTPKEERRICKSKGACACRGCLSSKGIKQSHLDLYEQGKLV